GCFREDLYYRINVMSLQLPPLRERHGDIPLLVRHMLGDEWTIDADAMQAVEAHRWPGNVRQLMNALERAQIMADGKRIRLQDLPRDIVSTGEARPKHAAAAVVDGTQLADVQRAHIVEVLRRERGNKARTARALGVNRRSLYRLMEKYHIETPGEERAPQSP